MCTLGIVYTGTEAVQFSCAPKGSKDRFKDEESETLKLRYESSETRQQLLVYDTKCQGSSRRIK